MKTANLAIVFTDIKGFTARTSQQTYEQNQRMLRLHEALLAPVFKAFGGRRIKTIGDAFLVVFESPTQAVLCGVAIQDRLWDYNRRVAEAEQIHVRVAVNMGEVRLDRGDVYGEPVNIAARVEGIADAGEVLFTEAVHLAMNKAEVAAEDHGEHVLKGIPDKVRVYRVPRGGYRLTATSATAAAPEAPAADAPPYGGIALGRINGLPAPDPDALLSSFGATASEIAVDATRRARAVWASVRKLAAGMSAGRRAMLFGAPVALLVIVAAAAFVARDPVEATIANGDLSAAREAIQKLEPGGRRTYLEGRVSEALNEYDAASRRYVEAARAGHRPAYRRLLLMTEGDTCRARASAAQALARLGDRDALSTLRSLESSTFADEGGDGMLDTIFGCQSRRAARQAIQALEAKK